MRGTLLRILIITITFLLSATWFPQSFLPIWILVLAANFFSLREGIFAGIGFCVFALSLQYSWPFFFLLWISFCTIIIIKMLNPNGKVPLLHFFIACLGISLGAQLAFYRNTWENIAFTSISHIIFIAVTVLPAKILGEAYQRYFNALGRNYE